MKTLLLVLLSSVCFFPTALQAAGKKPQPVQPTDGKRLIQLNPVLNAAVELPDQTFPDYGQAIGASLTTQLINTGKFTLLSPESQGLRPLAALELPTGPTYSWVSHPYPAGIVSIQVEALNFRSGARGDRMYYGFDERFRTPFNNGSSLYSDEFPLKTESFVSPNWFSHTFDRKGIQPFDSQSGLDLGDGFTLDALMAWLTVKYASYQSELHLTVTVQFPEGPASTVQKIAVKTHGFFFDVAGAYQGYSAGIAAARGDAMGRAVQQAIDGSFSTIQSLLSPLPILARIDYKLDNGDLLLATGADAQIPIGSHYQILQIPGMVIQIVNNLPSGSVGRLIQGDLSALKAGMIAREVMPGESTSPTPPTGLQSLAVVGSSELPIQRVTLPPVTIPETMLDQLVPIFTRAQALIQGITDEVYLPYRIARYWMYDQSYHVSPDYRLFSQLNPTQEIWGKKIGLDQVQAYNAGAPLNLVPIVGVIDSGIDYNHPDLHSLLWINPDPLTDVKGHIDHYGWDFISNDSRPYDDGYHGTQVASAVAAVSPQVQLMPLKAFNPYGITNSASLYGAFQYAVDHGASVIVCAWSTPVASKAIEMGVAYARDHGVIVVASAGDDGQDLELIPAFPASLSGVYDNVVTVGGSDTNDLSLNTSKVRTNFSAQRVQIAAPAMGIMVAEPRSGRSRENSTGLAAALVAGALSRDILSANLNHEDKTYVQLIRALLERADEVESLKPYFKNGKRLKLAL